MCWDAVGTADTDLVDGALQNLRQPVVSDLRPEVRRVIIAFHSSSLLLHVVFVFSRRVPARQPQQQPRRLSRRRRAPNTTT